MAGVGVVRVRREEPVEVPAAVVREVGDAVAPLLQQGPQTLRGVHATGETARHPDDRHRLVDSGDRGGDGRDDGTGVEVAEELVVKVSGESLRCRVVEDHRGREGDTAHGGEGVAQFDRDERVDAEVAERQFRTHLSGAGVTEGGGGTGAHLGQQFAPAVLGGEAGEAVPQCGRGGGGAGLGGAVVDLGEQRARADGGERGAEAAPVDVGDQGGGGASGGGRPRSSRPWSGPSPNWRSRCA